jgi:hypothetical protein
VAKALEEGRKQRAPFCELLAGERPWEELPHLLVVGEPQEEAVVRFEVQQFLEHGQAENLAVVHFGRRSAPGNQLSVAAPDMRLGERVVQRTVGGGDEILEVKSGGGHGESS